MGRANKKKAANLDNPENLKELGNKAFMGGDFKEAIKMYSAAIQMSENQPNAIYYSNRANAHLESQSFKECIEDCDQAIQIDPNFTKSYYRKAKALWQIDRLEEASQVIATALEREPENADYLKAAKEINHELEIDSRLAVDHPERKKFVELMDWMKD